MALPLNGDKDFVDMPGIPQPALPFFQFPSVVRTKLLTPLPDSFIGDRNASFSQEFFDLTEAQTESVVEPDGVTDNFRGKPVSLVAGWWLFHTSQSATTELN